MSEIPRWISSKKVEVVRTLLADDPVRTHSMRGVTISFLISILDSNVLSCVSQAMLLRETLGISADGSEKMYRDDETTAFEQRKADPLVWIDRDHRCVTTRVTIRSLVLLYTPIARFLSTGSMSCTFLSPSTPPAEAQARFRYVRV